jgi:phosphoribosylformylglycinamidine synthase PurS subunit
MVSSGWAIYIARKFIAATAIAMKARVYVTLKPSVLDPQGAAIGNALASLGFTGIGGVRQGKLIELDLAETDSAAARQQVEAMCRGLLANPVIEDYTIEITPTVGVTAAQQGSP